MIWHFLGVEVLMRKANIFVGRLALALLVLAAVMSTDESRRVANSFLPRSAWAFEDASPGQQLAPEKSACSAPEVIETVKSLTGTDNRSMLSVMPNFASSIDAIRTVSSSPKMTLCEARLTVKYDMMIPSNGSPGSSSLNETSKERIHISKPQEVNYKVEKTDDGQDYVTVIPSESDIVDQQNRQQQLEQQRYDQEQRARAFGQESIERQEQYERDLQERQR